MRTGKLAKLCALLALFASVKVHADGERGTIRENIATWTQKASTNVAVAISSNGVLYSPDGLEIKLEGFDSPPAISTIAYLNVFIASQTLLANGTAYLARDFTAAVYPTLYVFYLGNSTSTLFDSAANQRRMTSTATITGITANGQTKSETLVLSTVPVVSTYAYISISSFAVPPPVYVTTAAGSTQLNIFINVGSTGTYGLAGDFDMTSDVLSVVSYTIAQTSYTAITNSDVIQFDNPRLGIPSFKVRYRNTRAPKRRQNQP